LLEEIIRIRQNGTRMVTAMAFHPDGDILAAGYDDGSVILWDVKTGQARYDLGQTTDPERKGHPTCRQPPISGRWQRRLQSLYLSPDLSYLLTRDLDALLWCAAVSKADYRKRLIAFQPNQIREYELEQAFDYPGNFANLAASGDLPLIRSFFDYFREIACRQQ
jgi:WD40 repeat protein